MKKHLISWLVLCGVLATTLAMAAEGRGKFIRMSEGRIEVRMPDRDAPVILIVPADKPELAEEFRARARRLEEGQIVEFVYVSEDGKNYLREFHTARQSDRDGVRGETRVRDGERRREGPRDGEIRREGPRDGEVRREGSRDGERREREQQRTPEARLEQLERQMAELREQNLRLRRELEELRRSREEREPERRARPPEE